MDKYMEKVSAALHKIPQKWLIIAAAAGVLLLVLSSFIDSSPKSETKVTNEFESESYADMLEDKVRQIVSSITGEKHPCVAVTLETGMQYLYAGDEKQKVQETNQNNSGETRTQTGEETEKGYIIVTNSEGDEKAVVVTEYMPEIRGIAVVCKTGYNDTLKDEIVNSISSALGVSSRKIYVTEKYN